MSITVPPTHSAVRDVPRFTNSASHRTLCGALAEVDRPDQGLVVVCADDLQRVLSTVELLEQGAPVRVTHVHQQDSATPRWMRLLTDALVIAVLMGIAVLLVRQVGR